MRPLLALCLLAVAGCAAEWSRYPWASHSEVCLRETVGAGTHHSADPIPSAHGIVVRANGEPLAPDLFYRVSFSDGRGSQLIHTRTPAFATCIDQPDFHRGYRWEAEVRASEDGPLLYKSSSPQPFVLTEPIVVQVVEVADTRP